MAARGPLRAPPGGRLAMLQGVDLRRALSRPSICPLCRDRLSRGTTQGCEVCQTAFHLECARELDLGCPTLGCAGARRRAPTAAASRAAAAPAWSERTELGSPSSGSPYWVTVGFSLFLLLPYAGFPALAGARFLVDGDLRGAALLVLGVLLVLGLFRVVGRALPVTCLELGEAGGRLVTGLRAYRFSRRQAAHAYGRLQSRWGMARGQHRPVFYLFLGAAKYLVDDPAEGQRLLEQLRAWGSAAPDASLAAKAD